MQKVDVLLPFAVLLTLNAIFLAVWTAVDPLEWKRFDAGRSEDGQRSSYGRCVSEGTVSIVMLSLIAGTNFIALLYTLYMSFQTWNMTVAFNESRYVALAMVSIFQAILIGIPLLFLHC